MIVQDDGPAPKTLLQIERGVRTTRIVVLSLMSSCLMVAVIFMVVLKGPRKPKPVITMIGVIGSATMLAGRFLIPGVLIAGQRTALAGGDADSQRVQLAKTWMTTSIIAGALLEGAVFINLTLYNITRDPVSLAVAGVTFVFLPFLIPTTSRVEHWIEDQLRLIRDA